MGVLLRVTFVVLYEPTAEAADELAKFLHLEPGLAAKLFSMVHGEDYGPRHPVRAEPRYSPEVEAQTIGPGALSREG